MNNDFELFAEVDNSIEGNGQESVEIDLDGTEDYKEVLSEAAETMDMDPSVVELIDVYAYTSSTNLQALADDVEWGDLLTEKGGMEVIIDFLALDEHNQIISLHLMNFHGINLRDAIDSRDDSFVTIYSNEDEIINSWLEMNDVPERVVWYLDNDLILKHDYPNREMLANGDIIIVEM